MSDISLDWSGFQYNEEDKSWYLDSGWFPSFGQYSVPFGGVSITDRLIYSGESLIGETLSVLTQNLGIVVNYSANTNENSGWWGDNEGYDADYVQAINGVASLSITKDVYGIGILIRDEYVGPYTAEPIVRIAGIFTGALGFWTDYRNCTE